MRKFAITVNGQSYEVEVEEIGGAPTFAAAPAAPVETESAGFTAVETDELPF